jgi:predicted outer membrane lipoprotein
MSQAVRTYDLAQAFGISNANLYNHVSSVSTKSREQNTSIPAIFLSHPTYARINGSTA